MKAESLTASALVPSPEILSNESIRAKTAPTASSRVKFRPCIDIHQGKVKQIVGATLRDNNSDRYPLGSGSEGNFFMFTG